MTQETATSSTTLVVLAGGKSSRMQGLRQHTQSIDKGRLKIEGTSLIERTLAKFADDTFLARALNSNATRESFLPLVQKHRLDLFPDASAEQRQGPLAGILASLRWSKTKQAAWLLTVPCDCPFLPKDLWQKLRERQENTSADIVCAESQGRRHPVVALWRTDLQQSLETALASGTRKIERWTEQHLTESQSWHEEAWLENIDPFFNINRPEDLAQAEALVRAEKKLDERKENC